MIPRLSRDRALTSGAPAPEELLKKIQYFPEGEPQPPCRVGVATIQSLDQFLGRHFERPVNPLVLGCSPGLGAVRSRIFRDHGKDPISPSVLPGCIIHYVSSVLHPCTRRGSTTTRQLPSPRRSRSFPPEATGP